MWRCREPVLVIESDDWGMMRRPCVEWLAPFGVPSEWSGERLETPDDLAQLYDVLGRYRDAHGRPACLTANFIVANPDFDAMVADGFSRYIDAPLRPSASLVPHWRNGLERQVFIPQYHGRAHIWPGSWVRDLQADEPGARELCAHHANGGLSLLTGQGWRYHSEYIDWNHGECWTDEALDEWIREGLGYFQKLFGFDSCSTIAPHYLLPPRVLPLLAKAGVRYLQGAGYRICRSRNGRRFEIGHILGERSAVNPQMVYLTRTVKFDPRPQRPNHGVDRAIPAIRQLWAHGVPAILDCHRINFCGPWRDEALTALDELLSALMPMQPMFLTTVELGEAIAHRGIFHDIFTADHSRHLTPLDPPWRRTLRRAFQYRHARKLRQADG